MSLAKIRLDYVSSDGQTLRTHLLTSEAERVQWLVARPEGVEQHTLRGHLRDLQQIALAEGFALALARHDMDRARAHHDALILLLSLNIHQANVSLCYPGDDESRVRAEADAYHSGLALATHREMGRALFGQSAARPTGYPEAMAALAALQ